MEGCRTQLQVWDLTIRPILKSRAPNLRHEARKMHSVGQTPSPRRPATSAALVRSAVPPGSSGRAVSSLPPACDCGRRTPLPVAARHGLLAAAACAGFFRHPQRVPPTRPAAIVAPADGVIRATTSAAPLRRTSAWVTRSLPRVSIFLSTPTCNARERGK